MFRRYRKPRGRKKSQRELNFLIVGYILIVVICLFVLPPLYKLVKPLFPYIGAIIGIFLAFLIYRTIRRFLKRRKMRGELHNTLIKALIAMDSTYKTYTDEDEANRELVGILKSQGLNAIYQFRLPHGRTADAKVDGALIEGKLAPTVEEIDRLFGQLQAYSQTHYKVYIVIYGRITKESLNRIQTEIDKRYMDKVFIAYLKNPKRRRKLPNINWHP